MPKSTATKKEKLIKVCDNCDNPIFWTFAFVGAEYYCPSCGASRDMFFGKDVPATPKLLKLKKSLAIKWGQIKPHLYTGGGRRKDCKKCFPKEGQGEYHIKHLTPKEKKKMEWARARLEIIKTN